MRAQAQLCTKINIYIYYSIANLNIRSRSTHIPKKLSSQLKNLSARRATGRNSHTEDQQILEEKKLETTVRILIPTATWRQGFVHP